jgi:serine/threonine protein kinase
VSDRPLTHERQRCFECGISYPPDAPECEIDRTRLWPETIHRVWRVEGVIAGRPGGATCAAYHLHTGERVAIDVVRPVHPAGEGRQGGDAEGVAALSSPAGRDDDGAVRLLQAEAQALHALDQPNLLRLFETGIDEHGLAYLVTELGTARPLGDLMEEWQRTGHLPLSSRAASQIGRQLLAALVAAHRAGLAHQGLRTHHVFLLHEDEILAGRTRPGAVRLRGLRALSLGQTIRASTRADLRAVAALLYELLVGEAPSGSTLALRDRTIPTGIEPALWEVVARGLAEGGRDIYSSADEMLRALAVAVPPIATEVSSTAMATLGRTDPGAAQSSTDEVPVAPPASEPPDAAAGLGRLSLPSRMSGPMASLPAPPQPFSDEPAPPSSISGELQAVSFRDLIASDSGPRRVETLAQSRRRISAASLKIPALPPPSDFLVAPAAHSSHPALSAPSTSGEHALLEPTADLSALPIADYASQSSGRLVVSTPHAPAMSRQPVEAAAQSAPQEPVAVPEAIDPLAATGQVASPAVPSPRSSRPPAAPARAPEPEPSRPPGSASIPPSISISIAPEPAPTSTTGSALSRSLSNSLAPRERTPSPATSAEIEAQHSRQFAWAIGIAAVVALIALWLLLH